MAMKRHWSRISYYADWMADVMTWDVEKRAANHHKIGK